MSGLHEVLKIAHQHSIEAAPPDRGECDNRFMAWESASVKTWEILWLRGSTGSVTGNYLERRQQQTELMSNDIVLIQEHNQRIFYKARLFKPKTQL